MSRDENSIGTGVTAVDLMVGKMIRDAATTRLRLHRFYQYSISCAPSLLGEAAAFSSALGLVKVQVSWARSDDDDPGMDMCGIVYASDRSVLYLGDVSRGRLTPSPQNPDAPVVVNVLFASHSDEEFEAFKRFYAKVQSDGKGGNPHPGAAYVLVKLYRDLEIVPLGQASEALVEENYMPSVVAQFARAVADINSPDPGGFLTILEGEPGTGKTHLVQAFMQACPDSKFLLIQPRILETLDGPDGILGVIHEHSHLLGRTEKKKAAHPLVLVLEDADRCLAERGLGNINSISSILNLSDGIVGRLLNLRIIATTNSKIDDDAFTIDGAAKRHGRLSQYIEVAKLSAERANAAWQRLRGADAKWVFREPVTLAEVYAKHKEG